MVGSVLARPSETLSRWRAIVEDHGGAGGVTCAKVLILGSRPSWDLARTSEMLFDGEAKQGSEAEVTQS